MGIFDRCAARVGLTEIETTVLRRNADDAAMQAFAVNRPIWWQEVPANQRVSRQALIDMTRRLQPPSRLTARAS